MSTANPEFLDYVSQNYVAPLNQFVRELEGSGYWDDSCKALEALKSDLTDELDLGSDSGHLKYGIGIEDDGVRIIQAYGHKFDKISYEEFDEILRQQGENDVLSTEDINAVEGSESEFGLEECDDGGVKISEKGNSEGWIETDSPVDITR